MRGRLIPLEAGSGMWNMSVDQALLESVDATGVPVLRFYQWSAPTLSLGYFQKATERAQHSSSVDAQYVRRSTGGGAILHHHDLTYSIAVPLPPSSAGARLSLYRDIHATVAQALMTIFGVRATPHRIDLGWGGKESAFLCFQRRTDEDLVVSGYKVLGSAQRRSRSATLQHGSLLLRSSRFAPELPGITCLTGKAIEATTLADTITTGISQQLSISWHVDSLGDTECHRAEELQSSRFGAVSWLFRR